MDFLDPQKLRAHQIRLLVGYVLLAIAVFLATVVLLYQAHGFGVKQGKVIQNGLVFMSSTPGSAAISVNGKQIDSTNARLVLEAGSYTVRLSRGGYHDWQRALTVEGGSVEHFTYPFLVPEKLSPVTAGSYETEPAFSTQSPDRRWLLVQLPGRNGVFDEYDLKDPKKIQEKKKQISIPPALFTLAATDGPGLLEVVDWSNNNTHVLLRHSAAGANGSGPVSGATEAGRTGGTTEAGPASGTFEAGPASGPGASSMPSEYILFNRETPAESVNLTSALQLTPNLRITLQDKKYDHYFIHDTDAKTLSTGSLANPQAVPLINGVLAYKTYGSDVVLYTSPLVPQTDKIQLKIYQNKKASNIRTLAAGQKYLLGLSRYDGDWFVAASSPAENRVFIYKNPVDALQLDSSRAAVPVAILKTANPSLVAFSANSQLIMTQNGTEFAVYDAEYDRSHTYKLDKPMDAPQIHATWMDGHHLQYVSGGKQIIFDYDGTNLRELGGQTPAHEAYFDTGYGALYTIAKPSTEGSAATGNPQAHMLSATPLRTAADQ